MLPELTGSQLRLVRDTIARDCDPNEFDLFMAAAKSYGLDPFRKQILPLVFSKSNPEKRRMSIIVARDGLRVIAQRCGDYRPASRPPEYTFDAETKGPTNPKGIETATVYLWKQDKGGDWYEVAGQADWDEFAPIADEWGWVDGKRKPTGKKTVDGNWAKMPKVMIAKCAEAQALRAGWPDQFSGIYVEEEMDRVVAADMTASEEVAAEEERVRMAKIEASNSILAFFGSTMDRVPTGEFFDRVSEHLRSIDDPVLIDAWAVQNREPLKEFWAAQPTDALELKKLIEQRSAA